MYTTTRKRTSILPKEQKMITSVFVITIHLSELGLLLIDNVFAFLSTFDFLSTVHGDYDKGGNRKCTFCLRKNKIWNPIFAEQK